jgi:ubiquinone/menaquinone biosynthesis C-methylase UbiE
VTLDSVPELWKCEECGSGFVQNVLPEDVAQQLYAQGDSTNRWPTVTIQQQKPHEIVAELSRLLTGGKKHLDVGCNSGSLLDFSRDRGCLTTGIDFSLATRNVVEKKGHAWFPSFDSLGANDFDVITAFDLIEHLYDVCAFLQECSRRLKSEGRLVILTGNIDSLSAKIARQHWWYAKYPEHIVFPSVHFFSAHSMYKLERLTSTYPANTFRFPLRERVRGVVSGMLRGCYKGYPSLGPDHMLLTLRARADG